MKHGPVQDVPKTFENSRQKLDLGLTPPIHILVVEDDSIDQQMLLNTLRDHQIHYPHTVVSDGVDALAFLQAELEQDRPAAFLILLDLNMPRMSGLDFLRALRRDPDLHTSIVFVLTTSCHDSDRSAAYAENVAGFIVKEQAGPKFEDFGALLKAYLRVVSLPNEQP